MGWIVEVKLLKFENVKDVGKNMTQSLNEILQLIKLKQSIIISILADQYELICRTVETRIAKLKNLNCNCRIESYKTGYWELVK